MHDSIILISAFASIIVLWTLAAIHRELREVVVFLKSITTSIRSDTRHLTDEAKGTNNMLEELCKEVLKVDPKNIRWKG